MRQVPCRASCVICRFLEAVSFIAGLDYVGQNWQADTPPGGKEYEVLVKTRKKPTASPAAGKANKAPPKRAAQKNAGKTAKKSENKAAGKPKSKTGEETPKGFLSRIRRKLLIILLIVIAYPFVFTIIYKIPFIHPVSHLMVYEAIFGDGASRNWLELEDISPNLRRSILMSEDGQYCSHHGVDWGALKEVAEDALEGKATRGASTITMQLAKNLFLWNGRSYLRKGLEIPIAMWIDLVLGKRRAMEIYLNIVELDSGKFGVEEGAKSYFGISARDMSRRQAALLAVTLPNPKGRNAAKPTRSMGRVARIVERRARQGKFYVQCVFDQ